MHHQLVHSDTGGCRLQCILVNVQSMTHDDFREFGSIEYVQPRTYYGTLGHSMQYCLHDGHIGYLWSLYFDILYAVVVPVAHVVMFVD